MPEFLNCINLVFTGQLTNILTAKLYLINKYKMRAFYIFKSLRIIMLHNEHHKNCP